MPARWCIAPDGSKVSFEDAPAYFESRGIMPSYAVKSVLGDTEGEGSFNVRPSDVNPKFTCRRQRVWMAGHDYGMNPLQAEGMLEGSGFHSQLGAMEIEVPSQPTTNLLFVGSDGEIVDKNGPNRLEVCGVPMRGRIDWLFEDRIEDLKTKTPFWAVKFGAKGSGERACAYIWEPKSDEDDILGWTIQLSIYRVLREKEGKPAPTQGRVWRRYGGVKADQPRWKRFDFPLLDEAGLEGVVGEWMRGLSKGLTEAKLDSEAWKLVEADGREMVGSKGNYWQCDRCPCKSQCFTLEGLDIW